MAIGSPGHLLVLSGLTEFRRALAKADGQAADDVKSVLVDVAKPMAQHATGLALQQIPRIGLPWAENRIGVTMKGVYIVPKKRGARTPSRRRPKFGVLILERSYDPTGAAFEGRIEGAVEHALDRIAHTIEHA